MKDRKIINYKGHNVIIYGDIGRIIIDTSVPEEELDDVIEYLVDEDHIDIGKKWHASHFEIDANSGRKVRFPHERHKYYDKTGTILGFKREEQEYVIHFDIPVVATDRAMYDSENAWFTTQDGAWRTEFEFIGEEEL